MGDDESETSRLIGLLPDAVLVLSEGRVAFANPAALRLFGADPPEALLGTHAVDLVAPDSRPLAAARLLLPSPDDEIRRYHLLRHAGVAFEAELSGRDIVFRGVPSRLLLVRDVSLRARAHAIEVQTSRLASLGEVAAGLAHELAQPLNVIRMAAEGAVMLIERGQAPPDLQAEQFALIAAQSERAANIIDEIRVYSRRDSGPPRPFDAVAALGAALEMLRPHLVSDGLALTVTLPDRPALVLGRRMQLEQVALNLVANAHHALRDQGRGPSDPRGRGRVRVEGRILDDRLHVVFEDDGPGIPPEARARVFEPFFTTKALGRGTGLGLSVSFGLVQAMHGTLTVEDSAIGARFALDLPLSEDGGVSPVVDAPPVPLPEAFQQAHVLIVDDESASAGALAHILRAMGCRVTAAATPDQARAEYEADPADVVVVDVKDPDRGAEDLVRDLREVDPWQAVLVTISHAETAEALGGRLADERCAVLRKPVALAELGRLLGRFLRPPD